LLVCSVCAFLIPACTVSFKEIDVVRNKQELLFVGSAGGFAVGTVWGAAGRTLGTSRVPTLLVAGIAPWVACTYYHDHFKSLLK
jgi:hypothetical protein